MSGVSVSPPGLISVVIPAYNAQHSLRATLDSVFAQTWPHVEIIVVDDGSTDHTADLLAAYGERVRTICQPNGGLASARRTGVAAARGELIALMDADDLCRPERLAVQARVLQRWPEVVLCCSDFDAFDEQGGVDRAHASRYYATISRAPQGIRSLLDQVDTLDLQGCLPEETSDPAPSTTVCRGNAYRAIAHGNFIHPPTILFRRHLLETVGSFDPEAGSMCDWDWVARAAEAGSVAFVERPLLDYRLSSTQMSSPRHRIRASIDTLRVAERICRRDEALYLAELPRFRADLGFFCADAADAEIDNDKRKAAQLLLRSVVRFGRVDAMTLRVLLKLLTPGWALAAKRQRQALSGT
ncbi:glycosyltransferase [Sphaerotilus sp.]|uniref:glycosyltransferase family 2 protein n=1 Tax=Sphaerotilus sp. TaxID=2093942 RepID=UPI00286DF67F|nr:glycosyltransferase [Sphaerotilus sp.]